jgi:hypothetical protein
LSAANLEIYDLSEIVKEMIYEKTKEADWTAAGTAPREFHPGPC